MSINGDVVKITDGEHTSQGNIDRELNIVAIYDYGDDFHYITYNLRPNDREGTEWVGEWRTNGLFKEVSLKLKECRHQGATVKITEGREVDDGSNEIDDSSCEEYESTDSQYSRYVGKWSSYIISQGKRAKVYTAIIYNDLSAEWIVYLPDGSVNASMSFNKCVFQNGYVYFTDNGDISIKGTLRFRLGSNGLQTADGDNMVKE